MIAAAPKKANLKDPTSWPRSRQMADQLIHDIRTGRYLPGEWIPSTRTFSAGEVPGYKSMAIYTVTGVFALVKRSGLIEASKGRRMQVRPFEEWPEGLYDAALLVRHPEDPGTDAL